MEEGGPVKIGKDGTVRYDGFPLGVDNRRLSFDLPLGSLRNGVNVDVLTSGKLRMRPGIEQAIADAGAHSVFADDARMVWATASALKLARENLVATTLDSDEVRFKDRLSYVNLHGEIFLSNEAINGKLTAADEFVGWGVTPPSAAPTLFAVAGERYVMVTCAFVLDTGEVSGAPAAARVACGDSPSIVVTGIPQSSDPRVTHVRLYVTDLDGTVFFQHADVPAGTSGFIIRDPLCRGERLTSQFMQPPPAGQLIEYHDGRLYIAAGAVIYNTQPLRYGLYDPERDYSPEPERVRLLKSVEGGMFVSSDQTYFIQGIGTPEAVRRKVLPFRAIEGAAIDLPDTKEVMWLSERGLVRAGAGGAVKNVTEGTVAMETFQRACMGIIEHQGHKAAVAIAEEGAASEFQNDDFATSETVRRTELY